MVWWLRNVHIENHEHGCVAAGDIASHRVYLEVRAQLEVPIKCFLIRDFSKMFPGRVRPKAGTNRLLNETFDLALLRACPTRAANNRARCNQCRQYGSVKLAHVIPPAPFTWRPNRRSSPPLVIRGQVKPVPHRHPLMSRYPIR